MKVDFIEVPVGMYGKKIIARSSIATVEPTMYGAIIKLNILDKDGNPEVISTTEKYETILAWLNRT
jgi:hypothetical protein